MAGKSGIPKALSNSAFSAHDLQMLSHSAPLPNRPSSQLCTHATCTDLLSHFCPHIGGHYLLFAHCSKLNIYSCSTAMLHDQATKLATCLLNEEAFLVATQPAVQAAAAAAAQIPAARFWARAPSPALSGAHQAVWPNQPGAASLQTASLVSDKPFSTDSANMWPTGDMPVVNLVISFSLNPRFPTCPLNE